MNYNNKVNNSWFLLTRSINNMFVKKKMHVQLRSGLIIVKDVLKDDIYINLY